MEEGGEGGGEGSRNDVFLFTGDSTRTEGGFFGSWVDGWLGGRRRDQQHLLQIKGVAKEEEGKKVTKSAVLQLHPHPPISLLLCMLRCARCEDAMAKLFLFRLYERQKRKRRKTGRPQMSPKQILVAAGSYDANGFHFLRYAPPIRIRSFQFDHFSWYLIRSPARNTKCCFFSSLRNYVSPR